MKNPKLTNFAILATLTLAMACTDDYPGGYGSQDGYGRPITLSGEIDQVAVTRVNDNGFCDGDEMGVYIVDYQGNQPGILQSSGSELLDRYVRQGIRRAGKVSPPPAAVGRFVNVTLTLVR